MKTNYQLRYAAHPSDVKKYDTSRLREDFLIEKVFAADEVNMVYSMYDRLVVGGAIAKSISRATTPRNPPSFILTRPRPTETTPTRKSPRQTPRSPKWVH